MSTHCIVGFDGFIDRLCDVVDVRNGEHYQALSHMQALTDRLTSAKGCSCNIELVERIQKLGGNGPNLAYALALQGYSVDYFGAVGDGEVEPLFNPLLAQCNSVTPIAAPGYTDALEFVDGKVMLGRYPSLHTLGWQEIASTSFLEKLDRCELLATVNWTMLPGMDEIWEKLIETAPTLTSKKRWLFVDLADPQKRSEADKRKALTQLKKLERFFRVALSLNRSEAEQVLGLFHETPTGDEESDTKTVCTLTELSLVTIHSRERAAIATQKESCVQNVKICKKPAVTTGAGDNFNAGICSGLLEGVSIREVLHKGIESGSYYVTHGTPLNKHKKKPSTIS